ncbi:hypothetical protein BY458DRAFT_509658 [Sporodiniella umbellata]|nr:hypothetical protein BY458DRAFT_509658 [Sporodiniella umbellata]
MMLIRAQFQTVRLDELIEDIVHYFSNRYFVDETIQCTLNNNNYYARIVDHGIESKSEPSDIVRPNGRLRFPEAFVNPPCLSKGKTYKVQLVDENGKSLENYIRTVGESSLKREQNTFNHRNVQYFIRECLYKDTYSGSPWLIKSNIAESYSINITLPNYLKEAHENFFKSTKRRKTTQAKVQEERQAEKKSKREENLLQKAKLKEEKDRQKEERRRQGAVKYPLEDLDLPIYRKDPMLNWLLVDMSPGKCNDEKSIPYPSGGRPLRPIPHKESNIPLERFDSFLSIWSFLTVFAEPLKISAYSVDQFQEALLLHQPKAKVLAEYNASLLNVIIKERDDDTPNELINGDVAEEYIKNLEEQEEEMGSDDDAENDQGGFTEDEKKSVLPLIERGWQDKEQLRIGQKWDHKELRSASERRGWETSLIGCLNNVATPDIVPDLDEILQHLVPRTGSSAAEREKQYPTLCLKYKLDILEFLVNTVNESNLIKNYMEYCQEQISEYRKQKIELNKESKALALRRAELDRRERTEKGKVENGDELLTSDESTDDSDSASDENDIKIEISERRRPKKRHQNDEDGSRKKLHEDEVKSQEQKAIERQDIKEEEGIIRKKEEHLERCMRRYMTLRIRPLGKDRFYNQYMYLDNIGVSNTYGSGRLYVRSPSDTDIQLLMERDLLTDLPERHCGYGGGCWFTHKLMKEQGLLEENEWLMNRVNELKSEHPGQYKGWWKYYSEPEEIERLLSWLNPKGIRELKLKNEILKQQTNIVDSIRKRIHASLMVEEPLKRSARTKKS